MPGNHRHRVRASQNRRRRETLIPRETRLRMIEYQGRFETLNTTTYSKCREYLGESVIHFAGDESNDATTPAEQRRIAGQPLPPGLRFRARLTAPIDTDTAAAGDRIEADLTTAIKGPTGEELAPTGSRIRGRLSRVAVFPYGQARVELAFLWDAIEIGGVERPFAATEERGQKMRSAAAASAGLVDLARNSRFPPISPEPADNSRFMRNNCA